MLANGISPHETVEPRNILRNSKVVGARGDDRAIVDPVPHSYASARENVDPPVGSHISSKKSLELSAKYIWVKSCKKCGLQLHFPQKTRRRGSLRTTPGVGAR